MDIREAIQKRRSIRRFKPDPVSDDLIQQILESARLAPSGSNTQPWRFIVIKDAETRQKLQTASYNQRHVGQAPVIIACCADIKAFGEFRNGSMSSSPLAPSQQRHARSLSRR